MQVGREGGRERVNDSLETGGARNRTTKGARSSRFVVQMTLPIRMLRHPAGSSPRLNPSPWNPPLASRKGSQRGQRRVLGRVEPPTIFRDRNLILSDVNQEREREREEEKGLLRSSLSNASSSSPFDSSHSPSIHLFHLRPVDGGSHDNFHD